MDGVSTYSLGFIHAMYVTEFVCLCLDGLELGLSRACFKQPRVLDPQGQDHKNDYNPHVIVSRRKV